MQKHIALCLVIILQIGCGDSASTRHDVQISINAERPHPYLIDHDRVCVITRGGQDVARFDLYPDTGSGMSISNLYGQDEDNTFILIDNNGTWYYIDKSTGKLTQQEWHWLKDTPPNYLGTYVYSQENRTYVLTNNADRPEPRIYLVKDPNTQ